MTKRAVFRKFFIGIFLLCIILVSQNTVFAAQTLTLKYDNKTVKYSGISYRITIDDKEVKTDLPGIVFNKSTMFPLRAVFESLGGTAVWNSKSQIMDITLQGNKYQFQSNSSNVKINGKTVKMTAPAKKINDRLVVPVDFLKNIKELVVSTDSKSKVIKITTNFIGSIKEISSTNSGEKTIVTLKVSNHKGYQYYRGTDPNRIVVDFVNVTASQNQQEIKTESQRISSIDVTALSTSSTRVTINLNEMANFTVEAIQDGLKITVEKPVNAKLSYENSYDRVYFSLQGIKLADVTSTIKKYFTDEFDKDTFKYTMTIPASSALSLADDVFNINDSLVNTFEIYRDKDTGDTKLVINAKKEFTYFTSYNDRRKQTEINLLTPAKEGEVLVVIDAGHGGQDPGANNGNIKEKDLNLAIALKLEAQLKQSNVKTFMLRQDDTFVGLYDRPHIANALNATLFVSIHNNAIDSSKVSGTETLYFPEAKGDTAFTGEKFARLVQDSLISKLKTVNRKIIERPGLVVLKYTHMPAVLGEIGFVTNPTDLKNLTSEEFQQKTAEALRDAIVQALDIVKKEKEAAKELENETNQENESTDAGTQTEATPDTGTAPTEATPDEAGE